MQSKTLSILFADIQGYTRRTSRQTREENQTFVQEMKTFINTHVNQHNGKLVKSMGDGFLVTFESPTNAVSCGLAIQKSIEQRNFNALDRENYVRFRIGISTGEVNLDAEGDVYGDAVNIAARIEKFAEPNGVFISESTYLAMNKAEVHAQDLGPQNFKNVLREIRVFKVLKDKGFILPASPKTNKTRLAKILIGLSIIIFGGIIVPLVLSHKAPVPDQDSAMPSGNEPDVRWDWHTVAMPDRIERFYKAMENHVALSESLFETPVVPANAFWTDAWSDDLDQATTQMKMLQWFINEGNSSQRRRQSQ